MAPSPSRPIRPPCADRQLSHGQSFAVRDTARLSTVYTQLGHRLTRKRVHRQITAGFAGGGLALILLGAGMSLWWFGRAP